MHPREKAELLVKAKGFLSDLLETGTRLKSSFCLHISVVAVICNLINQACLRIRE